MKNDPFVRVVPAALHAVAPAIAGGARALMLVARLTS
jgi:hypothetical protein